MTICFRQAVPADLDQILTIEDQSFSKGVREAAQVFLERIKVFPEGFLLLETAQDPKTGGYISSELWPGGKELSYQNLALGHSIREVHNPSGKELYVSSMGVLPEYRGRGFGGQLLRELIDQVQLKNPQLDSVVLIVSEKWTAARMTYLKQGFTEVARIPAFFEPRNLAPEQGIVMRRFLRQPL